MGFGSVRIKLLNLSAEVMIGQCFTIDNEEELEALYRFRYRIYIEELGKKLPTADHDGKRLLDPDDSTAIHFIVGRRTTQPLACVRLHLGEQMPNGTLKEMGVIEPVGADGYRGGFVSKLMVERSLRGRGAALVLMLNMMLQGARSGGHYALFHCSPKLVALYERYGFQRIGVPFEAEHVGVQIPMISLYGDYEHYRAIGSPLAPYLKAYRFHSSRLDELKTLFHLKCAYDSTPANSLARNIGGRVTWPQ